MEELKRNIGRLFYCCSEQKNELFEITRISLGVNYSLGKLVINVYSIARRRIL